MNKFINKKLLSEIFEFFILISTFLCIIIFFCWLLFYITYEYRFGFSIENINDLNTFPKSSSRYKPFRFLPSIHQSIENCIYLIELYNHNYNTQYTFDTKQMLFLIYMVYTKATLYDIDNIILYFNSIEEFIQLTHYFTYHALTKIVQDSFFIFHSVTNPDDQALLLELLADDTLNLLRNYIKV